MDSSFTIKPSPLAGKGRALRDPVPVHEAVETELVGSRTVAAAGDGGGGSGGKDGGGKEGGFKDADQRSSPVPQDVVVDPASRDVIYRERDVRALEGEHPDQALLRQRAYRQAPPADIEPPPPDDPHADIKA